MKRKRGKKRRTGKGDDDNRRKIEAKNKKKSRKITEDKKERILEEVIDKWRILFGQKNLETIIDEKLSEKLDGDALKMWLFIKNSLKFLSPVSILKNTKHHVLPSSRGGTNDKDNLISKISLAHISWHFLFENKTIEEIITLLEAGRKKKSSFLRSKKKLLAWLIVFGDGVSFREAIVIVRDSWVKKMEE